MSKTKNTKARWYNMRRYARLLSKQVAQERGGYLPLHWDVVRDKWPGGAVIWKQLQYTLSPYYEPARIVELRYRIRLHLAARGCLYPVLPPVSGQCIRYQKVKSHA